MRIGSGRIVLAGFVVILAGLLAWRMGTEAGSGGESPSRGGPGAREAVAVEVAPLERRGLQEIRGFTGSLEAESQFNLVARTGGRLMELRVDLGDRVQRGEVVARLEDDEFRQQLLQAEAELEVAKANIDEAESELGIAERELERVRALRERQIASESDLDASEVQVRAAQARLRVAKGTLAQREAAVEMARLRLSHTEVRASWEGDGDQRAVAERFVSEGAFVGANENLLSLVNVQVLRAVIFVTERDYGLVRAGQEAEVTVDAFPGETFFGRVARLSPVFQAGSRQARVEIEVINEDDRLAPGMFARVRLGLRQVPDAIAAPRDSLVRRNGHEGLFVVVSGGNSARFVPVEVGLRDGAFVEIRSPEFSGNVVTLGQGQLTDGAVVRVIEREAPVVVNARKD